MEELVVNHGDVVVTNFGGYQHWSIVTDRVCEQGLPMLISATKRTGTVREEPWAEVTQGKQTYVAKIKTDKPLVQILSDARSQVGRWKYILATANCEHFVKWAIGLEVTSTQVVAGVVGAAGGALLVATLADNPKFIHFLGGALVVSGLAIALAKAIEKK